MDTDKNSKSTINSSKTSEKKGSLIISIKFFKFVTSQDINQEQREVEIIRSLSFVDIEGFNSKFPKKLINHVPVSSKEDPKTFSLFNVKNLFESMASLDFQKYSEVNSTLTNVIQDIMKVNNTSLFMFGFIDQNENSILESTVTLEIMNKFKNINSDYFFDIVQEMDLDVSCIANRYLKEEFHVAEMIVINFNFSSVNSYSTLNLPISRNSILKLESMLSSTIRLKI